MGVGPPSPLRPWPKNFFLILKNLPHDTNITINVKGPKYWSGPLVQVVSRSKIDSILKLSTLGWEKGNGNTFWLLYAKLLQFYWKTMKNHTFVCPAHLSRSHPVGQNRDKMLKRLVIFILYPWNSVLDRNLATKVE